MRFLYLARHGESVSPETDPNQPLSEKGKKETAQLARVLEKFQVDIDAIFHSTKLRAKQTAEIYAHALAPKISLIEREGLKPMDPVQPIIEELSYETENRMLVGHLPFMEKLLTMLLFGQEQISPFEFSGSSIVCLAENNGLWRIHWALSPQALIP